MAQLELDLVWDEPEFELFEENLQVLGDRWRFALAEELPKATELILIGAEELVPKKSGRLMDSLGMRVNLAEFFGSVGVRLEPPPYGPPAGDFAPYARAIIKGDKRRTIRPRGIRGGKAGRGGKAALWWPDARHPVRKVSHPATRAQPFLTEALESRQQRVKDLLKDKANRLLEEATI